MYTHTYPPEREDFASTDASRLDTWVFDEVKVRFWHTQNWSKMWDHLTKMFSVILKIF